METGGIDVEENALAALRNMLRISSAAQLLFDGEIVIAASPEALRLVPQAREGTSAGELLGAAAEQFRQFAGNGSMLLGAEVAGVEMEITLADCGGYTMATLVPAQTGGDQAILLAVAERLRQPMASILSVTPKLLPLLEETSDPDGMERAAELNKSLYSIVRLTGNLEQTAAPEEKLSLDRVDLDLWLSELTERLQPLCQSAGLTLRYRCATGRYLQTVDPKQMERALLNLVSNALKFSGPNGEITLSLRRSGAQSIITLRDRGCGISADEMPHVFRRSVHRGQIPDPRWGVGLGLPVARQIVQAHGGRLMLESVEGVGTAVHIALPAGSGNHRLKSPVKVPETSGALDPALVELSDALPASVYDPRGIDL